MILRKLPNFKTGAEFDECIKRLEIRNPVNKKGVLSNAYTFNLMFETRVGPLGD